MTLAEPVVALEQHDVRRARSAPGILRAFNDAAILSAADVHVARRLGALLGVDDDSVLLGVALAVRAPRMGHVCIDLGIARDTVVADVDVPIDVTDLPWPDVEKWLERLRASELVSVGERGPSDRPLRLIGTLLYLDRYWGKERDIVNDLRVRSATSAANVDVAVLSAGLQRFFSGDPPDLQRLASAVAVLRRFTVVAGGPGTGKTTTVARILALLDEQAVAARRPPPRVALAAPTGKAAARLQEAVHHEAAQIETSDEVKARLLATNATTMHRLLGWRPNSNSRFQHHRGNRLPHDVIVVDEASMVSLSLMAKLIEAVRPTSRLILVGDPDQLASVEAGAVLGDVVGPAAGQLHMRAGAQAEVVAVTGQPFEATEVADDVSIGDGIVVLRRVHRYGGRIAALAEAIQRGDADATLAVLGESDTEVRWIEGDLADATMAARLEPVRRQIVEAGKAVAQAARDGDGLAALTGLGAIRVLCAHRRGPYGVETWKADVERWLAAAIDGYATSGRWYVGRPLLVTENDYGLQLYNGDTGVIVDVGEGQSRAVFERRGVLLQLSPTRLSAIETLHAMTIHKSQGSQFDSVAVLLPDATSPILSRELLYTAVTRAQTQLTVVGTAASIRAAVTRPIARASGLREGLWT